MNRRGIFGWVLVAAGFLTGILMTILVFVMLPPLLNQAPQSLAETELILIPPDQTGPFIPAAATPIITPTEEPFNPDKFDPGEQVVVTGTQGQGLRVRDYPSLGSSILFLADEDENFVILGGPVDADEYRWWFFESDTDDSRRGWGVENYLERFNE
jgi:hypothetical protein